MTSRIVPPRLQPGMTLGVVAPSSPVLERAQFERGIAGLEHLGFRVVLAPHARDTYGYLAGHDRDRADDLLSTLLRDDIDGVICLRGGYGANRTANAIDRDLLAQVAARPPKPFIGYSDITVPHAVLGTSCNWVTYYGPMLVNFVNPTDYTLAAFRRALMETEPYAILPDPDESYLETIVPGQAEGELAGGCLQLVVTLIGTPWQIDLAGKVFFWEDVNLEPYEIDRALSQLIAAGQLQGCAGIVIGELARVGTEKMSLSLDQVFDDLIRPLGIPTLYRLPFGHGKHHAVMPIGCRVRLDATAKTLDILEPSVH